MAKIDGFRVKNFRALKDITLGKLWNLGQADPLTPLTAVIGKNGVGKSALFDAFGFLADCLKFGVEEACDARGRGGFQSIRSLGQTDPMEFQVNYRETGEDNTRLITYDLSIDLDESGRPCIRRELLAQRRWGQKDNKSFLFLLMFNGKGIAWKGAEAGYQIDDAVEPIDLERLTSELESGVAGKESKKAENVELDDNRKLGIATLGSLKQHPRIAGFRRFLEGWYLSYFTPDAARGLPLAGPQKHLNIHGDNLSNVVQFMERQHPETFQQILQKIAGRIPGIDRIETEKTTDNRLVLRFNDKGFVDPFYAQQMSDGTLKAFAYLLLLEDPDPPPFICIEEPENGLYHKLLETLAREFRDHAGKRSGGSQVFVTTHQPYFVDALEPEEVWVLEKGEDGFSTIRRASEDPIVKNMVEEGLPLGGLWYSDYLDAR